ncbi:MAG: VanW family protein [Defluviitaleaceae bacterium]|nr:VanW family protein [Defluviitaleaceae bacterium]
MEIYRSINEPKERNPIRQRLGVIYYIFKRHMYWVFGGIKFAKIRTNEFEYTYFSHQTPLLRHLKGIDISLEQNKITNLQIALKRVNKVTIYPGEVFSFWKLIGKTTERKGYLKGVILQKGAFSEGIGGGLCHLSGFLYWMSLHTTLTITERHRHGYDTTPDKLFGSDATCFYNYKDLMIRNDTTQPFQLIIEVSDDHLKGAWRSNNPPIYKYEIYEKEHLIQKEPWGGHTRHNHLHRKIYDLDGKQVGDEFVAENHAIVMD